MPCLQLGAVRFVLAGGPPKAGCRLGESCTTAPRFGGGPAFNSPGHPSSSFPLRSFVCVCSLVCVPGVPVLVECLFEQISLSQQADRFSSLARVLPASILHSPRALAACRFFPRRSAQHKNVAVLSTPSRECTRTRSVHLFTRRHPEEGVEPSVVFQLLHLVQAGDVASVSDHSMQPRRFHAPDQNRPINGR
mgnify:CR=1 FL=1